MTDATKPEAARPEAARPEAARPEAARPEAARPEAARYCEHMAAARRPALLVDIARAAMHALAARDTAPDAPSRHAALLRWAEIVRRSDPTAALAALAEVPDDPGVRRVRAHALLELERFGEARAVAAALTDGAVDLPVAARLAYLVDRAEALALAAAALAVGPDPEAEADLRCLRARWLCESGESGAAITEAEALIALCEAHDAAESRQMVELMRLGFTHLRGGAEVMLREALDALVAGFAPELLRAAPLPGYLHALMVRCGAPGSDGSSFVTAALGVVDLAEAAQRFEVAYSILHDGGDLARRAFGEAAAAPLEARALRLADRLGPARTEALHAWRQRQAETRLQRLGRG